MNIKSGRIFYFTVVKQPPMDLGSCIWTLGFIYVYFVSPAISKNHLIF